MATLVTTVVLSDTVDWYTGVYIYIYMTFVMTDRSNTYFFSRMTETVHTFVTTNRGYAYFCHDWQTVLSLQGVLLCYTYFCHDWQTALSLQGVLLCYTYFCHD